ncbi:MAG: hypothetical protein KatS3mg101_0176 [Patescibacteria group bacterium]|nr:MAG: hypothetical protein KatS3mg101_0176 [Patescibacteria group bacterium]
MDEKIETPTAEQPQTPASEPTPDWNTPKPVEDELKKYSEGKGLKIFFVLALIIILAAIGLFLYKMVIVGVAPSEQLQRQPSAAPTEQIAPVTTTQATEKTTAEEVIKEIDSFDVNELDKVIEETDLGDLNL